MISYNEFFENFSQVRERVAEAARSSGREAEEVEILPVTKTHPVQAVDFVRRAGISRLGENRVQEAARKRGERPTDQGEPLWDLIGHLQSNKAAQALRVFDRIQSVDSWKLADRLERLAAEAGRRLPCLIQVNTAADPGKFGFSPSGILAEAGKLATFEHLVVEGLMTIGPLGGGRDAARWAFAALRELAEKLRPETGLALDELSMGMSGDIEEAVAEGSTLVRVGSALFGARVATDKAG